ncbi:tetratricopeptide repeat protein [Luteolibacter marinus]|uniref:tetratricopeptide repeat protein n=1 Tax=Luteolibacter marinus TaxID=2776705 RepID=UPI001868118A
MNIRTVLCLVASGAAIAQEEPQRAQPVDPALQSDPGQDWYQHGRNLLESAKQTTDNDRRIAYFAKAVDVLSRYLDQYPNHPNSEAALWCLGESYYGSGRIDDAKRCFDRLLNRYPKGRYAAAAAYRLAADYFNSRRYALAAPLFEKMAQVAAAPADRQRGLFHAGFSYELQGRTREAIEFYRKVIADPDQPNAYDTRSKLSLGRLLARAEKLDEAMPLLDDVVMSRSSADLRGPAAIEAGTIAAKQGNMELSDKYLQLVLDTPGMEKYRPDAQYALMAARFDKKEYKKVIEIFRSSSAKAEGEKEARRLMLGAKSYMMLERNVEALETFREVEKLMLPNNSYAFEANYLRLLCFYRIEGRHVPEQVDAFLKLYSKSHPRDTKIHTALLMKAETLLDAKKTAEAAKVYNEIDSTLLREKDRAGMLFQRAWCLAHSEDPQGAIRSFTEFINGNPKDDRVPKALILRASAYRSSGEPLKALADYNQLIEQDNDAEFQQIALLESADICKQQQNLPDMISRYRSFLEKFPDASDARKSKANYWLAWGLVKSDQVKDAIPHAENARKLDEKVYGRNAGTLLALAYWTLQQPESLCDEVDRGIKDDFVANLPDQLIGWAAMQAFNANRFDQAARFYDLVSDEESPRSTPKETWRYFGKALLAAGKPEEALPPINFALDVEDNPAWIADGLLDKAKALFALGRTDESMEIVEECQALRPQGRVNSEIRTLKGDIYMKRKDPSAAAGEYVAVVQFLSDDDKLLKPLVYWKFIKALEAKGDRAGAQETKDTLARKYPSWKPPAP